MDWTFIAVVSFSLLATFAVVGLWQRSLDREQSRRAESDLREARARGADRALAQYPMVDPLACIGCGTCVTACPEHGVLALVDGVARVVNGAKCVGHARCEQACPVGAIKVGLGDAAARPDIPVLTHELETSVPGMYIAGELGGIALIRHAIDQGRRAADAAAARLRREAAASEAGVRDLVIFGAGPAGLSAALRAKELGLDYQVVSGDDAGGTIRKYPRRKLTLVQTVEIPLHGKLAQGQYEKEAMLALWESLIARHRVPIQVGASLLSARREGGAFIVETSAGALRCRALILALGRRGTPRRLGVPGEDSEKVLYQLLDAATYTGQRLLVVGGGDSAVEAATALADQPGNQVAVSYRKGDFFRLKARNEQRVRAYAESGRLRLLLSTEVESVEKDSVTLRASGQAEPLRLPNDYVFVFAGGEPPFPLLKKLGIRFGGEPANAPRPAEAA